MGCPDGFEGQRPATISAWAVGPGPMFDENLRAEGPIHFSKLERLKRREIMKVDAQWLYPATLRWCILVGSPMILNQSGGAGFVAPRVRPTVWLRTGEQRGFLGIWAASDPSARSGW